MLAAKHEEARSALLYAAERLTVEAAVWSADAEGALPADADGRGAEARVFVREVERDLRALHAAIGNAADTDEELDVQAAGLIARSLLERAERVEDALARGGPLRRKMPAR